MTRLRCYLLLLLQETLLSIRWMMMMMMMNLFIIVYLQQLGYDRLSPNSSANVFISIFQIQLQFFHLPDRISKYACLKWTTSYPVGASVQPLPEREGV
ncbi:hypothetical protein BZA70DRAFT_274404 [Myxozyma melibiosi]|uniref:Secreted protein n=1 Tax=Myxozyma melibiosi TaxID=54550 RepID=A0ABR1F9L6_9ASCO